SRDAGQESWNQHRKEDLWEKTVRQDWARDKAALLRLLQFAGCLATGTFWIGAVGMLHQGEYLEAVGLGGLSILLMNLLMLTWLGGTWREKLTVVAGVTALSIIVLIVVAIVL